MAATLTWYGQASYLLETGRTSLLIDPYFSDSIAYQGFIRQTPPPVKKGELSVDFVAATHDHGDHLDVETLRDVVRFKSFYGPASCVAAMKKAGFANETLRELNRGDRAAAGDIGLLGVHAEHTPDSIGIIAECEGTKLFFTGDTLMHRGFSAIRAEAPDVLLICINGKFGNMSWQEAVVAAHSLGVKTVVPAHYDLFVINAADPALFASAFERSLIRAVVMEVGEKYDVAELARQK